VRTPIRFFLLAACSVVLFGACSSGGGISPVEGGADSTTVRSDAGSQADAIVEVAEPLHDGPLPAAYCDLPGSLLFGAGGKKTIVAGGKSAPSLDWLTLPDGFCAHYFAHVSTVRQVRFAPGGELFVASPSTATAGGAPQGLGAIVVLSDDDGDGYADGDVFPHADMSAQKLTLFQSGLASTQGIMFAPGYFYYQDTSSTVSSPSGGTAIMRIPYTSGQRAASGTPELVADITIYESSVHWPKTLDIADDGTIFVGNGGDEGQVCDYPIPFTGGVLEIGGSGNPVGGTPVARGFRNPFAIRCQKGHDLCFATELGLDGSAGTGGREKLVPIRAGDDWGFPCCETTNRVYDDVSSSPNCSTVATEPVSLVIGDTPFGLDFETGVWPAPYTNDIVLTLHGAVGSWVGARVLVVPTQTNGMPVPSSDLGSSTFTNLATGWDDGMQDHGRPAAISFSADGRAFIANDIDGDIFWIAPKSLKTSSTVRGE
jgi:glucose/arabinose dehydrogenase